MPPVQLGDLAYGDRVQHELRVAECDERRTSNGDPFLILTLGNASGQIETAPIWSNLLRDGWASGVQRGVVVQAIGHVTRYNAKRQLELTAPLTVLPRERFSIDEFLPRIAHDPVKLWDELDAARARIRSNQLRRVVELFFDDDAFRLRFERLPASIAAHHAQVGGLLLHVWEVTYIARAMARAMRANADLVITGALLHDIGKVEAYDLSWEGFVRTPCGHLIEHVVLGCLVLERRLAALTQPLCSPEHVLELQHLILSHHGVLEFGSPVRPLTLEAEIVHRADDASAKGADVSEALADQEAFREGETFADRSKVRRVDRRSLWRRPHSWD